MSEYYYVYCDGILGVHTNISNFKWVYGSLAPNVTQEEYNKCIVKFEINLLPESKLIENVVDDRFQAYSWDFSKSTISCRRSFLGKIKIGYDIILCENKIVAHIGENYYRFVKHRVMNLHSMYYLLSDLANVFLLQNGYLTLYASAVSYMPLNKGIVFFAAPNMGKTYTAINLCKNEGYSLVGEDIVIVKGNRLHACPWTSSYRKNKSSYDSAGSFGRTPPKRLNNICETCEATDIIVITAKKKNVLTKTSIFRVISILNGYLFNYYSSPIIKLLGYFDESYYIDWNQRATVYLKQLLDQCQYHFVYIDDSFQNNFLVDDVIRGNCQ